MENGKKQNKVGDKNWCYQWLILEKVQTVIFSQISITMNLNISLCMNIKLLMIEQYMPYFFK